MAAKKAIAGLETMEQEQEVSVPKPAKAAKAEADPWSQMVEIRIPKKNDGSPNYTIASVNGKVFKVMNGVNVKVPAPIAEVIEHSFEAQDEAELFIQAQAE